MSGWGVLTHVDTGATATESLGDAIELARAAEALGYESFWVAQHRFGHQGGAVPSPLIFLAAIAQHTSRIQLGTASIAPAFEDPRRLLEDAAVLDALSAGRLQLGLGSGSSEYASQAWGMDHQQRQHRNLAAVDAVRDGVQRGIGTGDQSPVVPPLIGLDRRFWLATGSADGAEAAAQRRMGLIVGRRAIDERGPRAEDHRVAELIRHYRNRHDGEARVAVSRPIIATNDPALARSLQQQEQRERYARNARGNSAAAPSVFVGAPDEIVAELHEDPARGLIDQLLVHTRPLTVPPRRVIAGLELIAEQVRPETESIFHDHG